METIIKYIKLPLRFDTEKMLDEVLQLTTTWLPHYNTNDYSGEWKALPLRSVGGDTGNVLATTHGTFRDTELMQQCPAIKLALDSLLCEKTSVRILNLRPGAVIKEHSDPGLCYEEGEIRLHIPLATNEHVDFFTEDEQVHLLPGECWYINFNLKHRLANKGTTDRIHLVVDCIVNDWLHELFASCNEEQVKSIPAKEKMSEQEKRMMIEELKKMGTDIALEMAIKMENELKNSI